MKDQLNLLLILLLVVGGGPATALASDAAVAADAAPAADDTAPTRLSTFNPAYLDPEEEVAEPPWDYWPYRVELWIASDHPRVGASQLAVPLQQYLDREFSALWRLTIRDAPVAVRTAATRDLAGLDYGAITSADPVIALKRNHSDAPRIRFASDVGTYVTQTLSTPDRIAEVLARAERIGNQELGGAAKTFTPIAGDAIAVAERWAAAETEAILTDRASATTLRQPDAKIIPLAVDNLVSETIERSDKLFIVHVETTRLPWTVSVVEMDCLMRNFSGVHRRQVTASGQLASVIGQTVTEVFGPLVRIEDAGKRTAVGRVRAEGLITGEESPARIHEGDFLVPMVRRNDRNGDPIGIGPIDWAYLHVKEIKDGRLHMDYHAGMAGGLQGRQNKRTFRTATRVRPLGESTTIRLHAQRAPDAPLVGYEIYERTLGVSEMTLVGRTDWDGRLRVEKTDTPMRLLYVKNGDAVLARLPVVPGQTSLEVADLVGDDQRLRAEAYIRGTQNAIIDLVAIRQLFAARIRMRLENGRLQEAKELLELLRNQPTYEKIAGEMGRKLIQLKGRNPLEQRKIDQMFAQTREMLVKNISPALLREIEEEVLAAERQASVGAPQADTAAIAAQD